MVRAFRIMQMAVEGFGEYRTVLLCYAVYIQDVNYMFTICVCVFLGLYGPGLEPVIQQHSNWGSV